MKKCIRCNVEKPSSDYEISKYTKVEYKQCKSCITEMENDYLKKHTDKNGNYIEKPFIGSGRKKKQ